MNNRPICAAILLSLFSALAACCIVTRGAEIERRFPGPARQSANDGSTAPQFDPLPHLTSSFPGTIELKRNGHLLEFCPDNTCNGFVSSSDVPVAVLKDFAYLYIYFFSDYTYLPDWRSHPDAKDAAERILSKPEYRNCKREADRQGARCVLLDLSRGGKIKLIFVGYDEGRRNVVPKNIAEELSERKSTPKQ